jgi:uncharacterized protein YigE (DUF2233 family)
MMKKMLVKNINILTLMLCSLSVWSQSDSCQKLYDSQIASTAQEIKTFSGTPQQKDNLQKSLNRFKKERDNCIASQKKTNASPVLETVKADTVKKASPSAASPIQAKEPEHKPDSIANSSQDNKLPPTESVKKPTKADPKKRTLPGPPTKVIIKDTAPPPPPKPGLNYHTSHIDTLAIGKGTNAYKVEIGNRVFDYIVVDLTRSDIKLHLLHPDGPQKNHNFSTLGSVYDYLVREKKEKVEMLTNGGMYMHNQQPQGLFIENKIDKTKLDTTDPKNGDNFHLMPNGVFLIREGKAKILTTDSFKKTLYNDTLISYATQSGPMLVIDGKRHPVFTEGSLNEKLRSGVAVIDEKHVVFALCDHINFWDFADFFKDYIKSPNALFLDGAVSRMFLGEKSEKAVPLRRDNDGNFGPIISVTAK